MGLIFLILFGLTLFVLYIAVRRTWASLLVTGTVGAMLSVLFVVLYALTYEDTSTEQAIFAGIIGGLGFSGAVIVIASFFRTNQPSAEVQLKPLSKQEDKTSGQEVHRNQTPE